MPETNIVVVQLLLFGTQLQDATPQPYPCSPDPKNRNPLCTVTLAQYNFQLKIMAAKARTYLINILIIFTFMTAYLIPLHLISEQIGHS
jgi:hypothetical protein